MRPHKDQAHSRPHLSRRVLWGLVLVLVLVAASFLPVPLVSQLDGSGAGARASGSTTGSCMVNTPFDHGTYHSIPQSLGVCDIPAGIVGEPPASVDSYVRRPRQEEALEFLLGGAVHQHKKVVVMGPPGSGKTTVALNYALANKERLMVKLVYAGHRRSLMYWHCADTLADYGCTAHRAQH